MTSINEITEVVNKRAKEYGAERVYLFGSYARGDANENSDVDLRIDKGRIKGMALAGMLVDLMDDLKLPVDLLTTNSLEAEFLERIKGEERLIYGKE